jgi:serine/threonine protein kinase
MIGEGTYGKVFLAKLIATQEVLTCKQIVAIKKIRLDKHSAYEGIQPTTLREISLLKELNHPNIVCLKDVLLKSKHIYLIFEYVKNDLHSLIVANKPNTLKKEEAKSIIYQLLKAISYMHKMGILHRDVKPQNILVSNEGVVKIADFGLARFAPEPQKQLTREVSNFIT